MKKLDFHYTVQADGTMKEAITALEDALKEESFGILWTFDIKDKLTEKGFTVDEPYMVLELCNPQEAERVLKENKLVGYFLPCKIVVYQDQGAIKIGLPKPTALIGLLDDPELKELAGDIERRLIGCIDRSIKK
ncbi:DUF302 domain-containing protein [Rossellomorea marisflavi]|uniref:DUF302 domain-containing protein n=1 Tax=Rossellomorea marisflavi TaxID=189381 RepID=UPI001EE2ADEC|nr:DUF302 domain-containing protein [Rossellomorea marisflavi]UKS65674.1 DUF302 domain-containing protein [Rossellomorea marisflavi]WJV18612.1 DUF302 domain-containing protein [Rossellomorea marisflavi]